MYSLVTMIFMEVDSGSYLQKKKNCKIWVFFRILNQMEFQQEFIKPNDKYFK